MRFLTCAGLLLLGAAVAAAQTDLQKEEALLHVKAGNAALEVERWDEAEREFNAAIQLDPRLELAYCGLGRVHMATRRYPRAIDAFTSCRSVFLGNVAEGQGQQLEIEQRIQKQLVGLRDLRNALGSGRVRSRDPRASMRRIDDQIRQLERLRGRAPDAAPAVPPYILTALGSAYFRTGAFAEAEREWREAVSVDPSVGEIHNNLAVVLMLTNRLDEAEKEIALAERHGFRVSQGLKDDLEARKGGRKDS